MSLRLHKCFDVLRHRNIVLNLNLARSHSYSVDNGANGSLQKSDKKHSTTESTTTSRKTTASNNDGSPPHPPEDVLKMLEMMRTQYRNLPFDVFETPAQTMDLHIPSFRSARQDATLLDHLKATGATFRNWFQNALSMYRMAKVEAFPQRKIKYALSLQLFRSGSTSEKTWTGPLRKIALDTYKQVNEAVANHDEKTIKRLTTGDQREHCLNLVRSQDLSRVYVWKFHSEVAPCRIVSLRAVEGYLSPEPPKTGNRLIVQMLVKFDTKQSLEIYSKKGTLLQGRDEPQHVVEYLVLQSRMWHNSPWILRERIFENVDGKYIQGNVA